VARRGVWSKKLWEVYDTKKLELAMLALEILYTRGYITSALLSEKSGVSVERARDLIYWLRQGGIVCESQIRATQVVEVED